MRTTRFLTTLLALAVIGFVPLGLVSAAQAAPRPISVVGTEPGNKNVFYLKGDVGADYAGKKVTIERRDRPGAAWRKVSTIKAKSNGRFKTRIFKAAGSRKTCFRIKTKAVGPYEATKANGPCIVTV